MLCRKLEVSLINQLVKNSFVDSGDCVHVECRSVSICHTNQLFELWLTVFIFRVAFFDRCCTHPEQRIYIFQFTTLPSFGFPLTLIKLLKLVLSDLLDIARVINDHLFGLTESQLSKDVVEDHLASACNNSASRPAKS